MHNLTGGRNPAGVENNENARRQWEESAGLFGKYLTNSDIRCACP